MKLEIIRKQYSDSLSQYNNRIYTTQDDDLILDWLNAYMDEHTDMREWIEDNIQDFICEGNDMTLGYRPEECDNIEYNIRYENDKINMNIEC